MINGNPFLRPAISLLACSGFASGVSSSLVAIGWLAQALLMRLATEGPMAAVAAVERSRLHTGCGVSELRVRAACEKLPPNQCARGPQRGCDSLKRPIKMSDNCADLSGFPLARAC